MERFFDPNIWVGLLTLVTLEIVLGIDNLIFIAILAPLQKRKPVQKSIFWIDLSCRFQKAG